MKKVYIKYNPYKLETELTVDGQTYGKDTWLGERCSERMQEWIEKLPEELTKFCNDNSFDVTFYGTQMDYEDVKEVFEQAQRSGLVSVKLRHESAKEAAVKLPRIDELFARIQEGPFPALKEADVTSAYEQAKNSDFEVCVVATMSAGKSTLINAMLGKKLMPSASEACTAIITRIRDKDDSLGWKATACDRQGHQVESFEDVSLDDMNRLNKDGNVAEIHIEGDIPFVSSAETSLVLVDTPGPNNARAEAHREIQEHFLSESSKALVLYIADPTYGKDDDDNLLRSVSESMKVGGKQSKDRFLFVVNKLDGWRGEDGDLAGMLGRVREYLGEHDIGNPNIFPAAALPAQLIRSADQLNEDDTIEMEYVARKLRSRETLHFEQYAPLPAGEKAKLERRAAEAKASGKDMEEALIYTGVPSIEAAIRQYVEKYAVTAKVKNVVDTFKHKLEASGYMEKTKKQLSENQEQAEKFKAQIERIRKNINDAQGAKSIKDLVDGMVVDVCEKNERAIKDVKVKFQKPIDDRISQSANRKLNIGQALAVYESLRGSAETLEADFVAAMDEVVRKNLIEVSDELLAQYKQRLVSLAEEVDLNDVSEIHIDPMKLLEGSFKTVEFSVDKIVRTERVADGEKRNPDKAWYKPWTWFKPKWVTNYRNEEYVLEKELVQELSAICEAGLNTNVGNAMKHVKEQASKIAGAYKAEFERLDGVLEQKLAELESCIDDEKGAEERIRQSQANLDWLEDIKKDLDAILEI